ncbi:hypothetical protein [Aeromonas finlandensis]|uniref:hypothetical protein n=1 Tax=Aeromonas finlandensis TaxID=1543375 RepID=UPI0012E0338D|nr:hypothetical protein [Aeromonas finlandensis]
MAITMSRIGPELPDINCEQFIINAVQLVSCPDEAAGKNRIASSLIRYGCKYLRHRRNLFPLFTLGIFGRGESRHPAR